MAALLRRLWRNEYFKTAVTIALIPLLVAGFWFGLQAALNTRIFPLFTVTSHSMCIPPGSCDSFSHAFERTIHIGDLLVIQGVDPRSLNTNYPDSDIIVFQKPDMDPSDPQANVVHRITSSVEVNGTLYFYTKGDGNGYPNVWPNPPISTNIDPWRPDPSNPTSVYDGAISEDYVYGKVIMRIPWVGSLSLLAQAYTFIPVVLVIVIVILVLVEFVLPLLKQSKNKSTPALV